MIAGMAANLSAVYYSYNYNVAGGNSIVAVLLLLAVAAAAFAIPFLICWLLSSDLAAVPLEDRQRLAPGQVCLLVIPLFNLVWNFFVFPRIADSFRNHFERTGQPLPGDYGRGLGIAFSVLLPCVIIPCLGPLCGLAALVLLILLLVKFGGYKAMALSGGGAAFPIETLPPR